MFTKSLLITSLLGLAVLRVCGQSAGDRTTADVWSSATQFVDAGLNPLDAGTINPGDGDLIQIGYFNGIGSSTSLASFGAAEWATFTPISGRDSLNPALLSEVGPPGSSGPLGLFTFNVEWEFGTDALPADFDYRIGLRVYDGDTVANSTNYNTLSSDAWRLPIPATPTPSPPFFDLDNNPLVFEGTPWITDIALVPEPGSSLLVLLAGGLLLRRRRRA